MDISKRIAEMKKQPGFQDNVGMILIHNGTVRGWSRQDNKKKVAALEVTPDLDKIESIRQDLLKRDGIYDIVTEAKTGHFQPGDDLLFLIVAGDIRENIKPVLAELLDRVKSEAISKKEIMAE
ncbi:MAG: molybdenum cofactor biosynthesis protein MoaE [Thermodesulfobacteriota bacterium]|nr:molybdenum cofactor biosynthesis protein MoaE [Thermodesulfobacteriota bacterium]